MTQPTDSQLEHIRETIVEEVYNLWMIYYSQFNWITYWPKWSDLDQSTKEFWHNHVKTILHKVKLESLAIRTQC